ncbi:MAG: lysophospholipid acyltransferase family protein [Candidatus Omnitrophota bacterium]|nr:1-acyl-sn-glycerol-3-phosphate acyltransferase [Candidatus Omnitrophota bacterium]
MLYEFCKALGFLLLKVFYGLSIRNNGVFPKRGPFILASNHESNVDPVVLGVACPRQLYYLAKAELFRNKLFGAFLKKINVLPLHRNTSDIRMVRTALSLLETKPIALFPQGTRGGSFNASKPGVGFLHRKTGVPVIAAYVRGTDTILPKGATRLRKGTICVTFSLVTDISPEASSEEATQKVIDAIKNLEDSKCHP